MKQRYYDSSGRRREVMVGSGKERNTSKSSWNLFPSKIFNSEKGITSCHVENENEKAPNND